MSPTGNVHRQQGISLDVATSQIGHVLTGAIYSSPAVSFDTLARVVPQ